MNEETVAAVVRAGTNLLVMGNYIFSGTDIKKAIEELINKKLYMDSLQQNPRNNLTPSAHQNWLYIAIGIILLLILGTGAWWYFSSKTPQQESKKETAPQDETADWKTYRNEEYGFEFKYPNNWFEQEPSLDFKGVNLGLDYNTSKMMFIFYDDISEVSWSAGSKKPKTLEEYMKDPMFQNAKLIEFLGNKAFSATFTNPVINLSETRIIVEHDGHIYEINYDNDSKLVDIEKSIISTFRFLE